MLCREGKGEDMTKPCLLLNADGAPLQYFPLSLIDWKVSVRLVHTQHVVIIAVHENTVVRSPSTIMQVPSIIMLKKYHKVPQKITPSRNNIFLRDGNKCQYCGEIFEKRMLTVDHVIPRSQGGVDSWSNLVTSCSPCNTLKGSSKIRPLKKPISPSIKSLLIQYYKLNNSGWVKDWRDYIGVSCHTLDARADNST